jgi:hypothetical protein
MEIKYGHNVEGFWLPSLGDQPHSPKKRVSPLYYKITYNYLAII